MATRASDVRLHVAALVKVAGAAPPLVLLHGFTGDSSTWVALAEHLGAERTVLAVDLVGHGRSPTPDDAAAYSVSAAVAQVLASVAGTGVTRAHWLGYSMGGRLLLNLALASPSSVASAVLVGASPGIEPAGEREARRVADRHLADAIERDGLEAFVDQWMAQPLFASQARLGAAHLDAMRAQRLRNRPHALALSLRGMGAGAASPVWDRLAELTAPVLLVAGALDEKYVAVGRRCARLMPRAELVVVPDVGHAAHVEAPAAVAARVRVFLAAVDAE